MRHLRLVKLGEVLPLVKVSVLVAGDTAAIVKQLAHRRLVSIDETVRRAITALAFIEGEVAKGHAIAVIEPGRNGRVRMREVGFVEDLAARREQRHRRLLVRTIDRLLGRLVS